MDLRCKSKKHAEVWGATGILETTCGSRYCGGGSGIVVLHRFDLETGSLVSTKRFKAPPNRKRGRNASHRNPAAVRSA